MTADNYSSNADLREYQIMPVAMNSGKKACASWRVGSVVRSTYCSCTYGFNSLHLHQAAQNHLKFQFGRI